jgi:hypothetical protein
MDGGPVSTNNSESPPESDFTERLVNRFFRRWYLYVVPVALFVAMGMYSASNITSEFSSYARLSATANPYVTQSEIRGTEIGSFESAAAGTARLINEQIQTDAFIDDVAGRAGLSDALEQALITRDDIRSRTDANADAAGENNLRIEASWADPDTAFLMVEATITGYSDYLAQIALVDSDEAVQFWTERRTDARAEAQVAEDELTSYLTQLPPIPDGQERDTAQVLNIQRLNSSLDRALEAERAAQSAIDEADFAASQALSDSSRQLLLVDAPAVASFPGPVRRDQAQSVVMFTLLGFVFSFAALLIGTHLDRSIRSRSQLGQAAGTALVAAVPRIKQLRPKRSMSAITDSAVSEGHDV